MQRSYKKKKETESLYFALMIYLQTIGNYRLNQNKTRLIFQNIIFSFFYFLLFWLKMFIYNFT